MCACERRGSTSGAGAYVFLCADLGFEPDEKLTLHHLAAQTWPRLTLLGKSQWPISNAKGVHVTRSMSSVSLALQCSIKAR